MTHLRLFSSLRNIRSVSSVLFQVSSPEVVSFVPLQASSPFPQSLKPCSVSSYYHYLLIAIGTFISLLVLISMDINRHRDGGNNDSDLGIFKGVEGLGNTQ